jgi:hypothetical protein
MLELELELLPSPPHAVSSAAAKTIGIDKGIFFMGFTLFNRYGNAGHWVQPTM